LKFSSLIKKIIGFPLHWQILIAMVLGSGTAITLKYGMEIDSGMFVTLSEMFGTLFVRLLRMVIVPLVTSSVIIGIAGVGDPANLGRLGLKTFAYYMLTSTIGIVLGLVLSGIIKPGLGVELPEDASFSQQSLNTPSSPLDIFVRMIPENPIQAMAERDMLAMIFFAILLGVAMSQLEPIYKNRLLPVIDAFFHAMMKLTTGIIHLAPIGVYGLIFKAIMELEDFTLFGAIAKYMLTIAIGLTIHMFIILPTIFYIMTRRSPMKQYRDMLDAILTAFSTSSSSATLPVTIECVEKNAGVSNRISSFVLPLGSTINMDGTALYECAGVLFIAQVLGIDLTLYQQLLVVVTALLASIGAAGVPSAGLVMIFIVLDAVGIQGDQVGLIVGTMLAVDRPLDMYRTVINIYSDSIGTVIIAHSEDEIAT